MIDSRPVDAMEPQPERPERPGAADAAVLAAMVAVFGWLFGLRHLGQGYSGDLVYRLQTNALLSGRLALFPTPHRLRYDEAWGKGVQQIWGLGMPLFRLPFEAAARAVGGFGFPDAITFVIFFALVALALQRVIGARATSGARPVSGIRSVFERAAPLALLILCPAFVNLCRTRFEVYEEAIGATFLWSLLLLALLLSLAEDPRPRKLLLLGAAAGLASQFRPTAVFYGGVALTLGLGLSYQARLGRRALAGGASLFVAGVVLQLTLNWIRFVDPFEWGQKTNIAYNTIDQLNKNFDCPFWHEPLRRALPELFSSLFLSPKANGYWFYQSGVLRLQSPTLRFREFYFSTFGWWTALLVVAAWSAVGILWWRRRRSETARALLSDRRLVVGALFSAGTFLCQAGFYVRSPAMTSRYAVDFAAAIACAMATLWWLGFGLIRLRLDGRRGAAASALLALAAFVITALPIARATFGETQAHRNLVSASVAAAELPRQPDATTSLPDRYRCGESAKSEIEMNGAGWDARRSCMVGVSTPFFLPESPCFSVVLGPPPGEQQLGPERTRPVRARRGTSTMIRVRDVPFHNGRLLTFCAPPGAPKNPTGIELISIAWIDPLSVRPINRAPLQLLEISTADR